MAFGTAERRKADVAEGVAIAVGHVATRHGNALGVISFGSGTTRTMPPRQGRPGMLGLLMAVRDAWADSAGNGASVGETINYLNRLGQRSKVVVIVSDFRGPMDWSAAMTELAGRNTVAAVEIRDAREQELPDVGELHLIDPETGRQLRVDTSRRGLRERFAQAAAAERAAVAAELRRTGVRHLVLMTAGDWLRDFAVFLKQRGESR